MAYLSAALRRLLVHHDCTQPASVRDLSRLLSIPYLWGFQPQPRSTSTLSVGKLGADLGRTSPAVLDSGTEGYHLQASLAQA